MIISLLSSIFYGLFFVWLVGFGIFIEALEGFFVAVVLGFSCLVFFFAFLHTFEK